MQNIKTHKVLDKVYTVDEGQGCFDGTEKQCHEFVAEQQTYGLEVVPMTKEEVEFYQDETMIQTQE